MWRIAFGKEKLSNLPKRVKHNIFCMCMHEYNKLDKDITNLDNF